MTLFLAFPSGSFKISSITLNFNKSCAVSFIFSAASCFLEESFHNILAYPSGDKIEYIAFSSIITLSATPIARAPPLEPSPITYEIVGILSDDIVSILFAITCPCPLSSAPIPGYAPFVSIKVISGLLNFSDCFINLIAFL